MVGWTVIITGGVRQVSSYAKHPTASVNLVAMVAIILTKHLIECLAHLFKSIMLYFDENMYLLHLGRS